MRYVIEDPYTRTFEVEESALPFWEHRPGHRVVGPVPDPGAEPTPVAAEPEIPGTPRTSKAAVRPAQNKEA